MNYSKMFTWAGACILKKIHTTSGAGQSKRQCHSCANLRVQQEFGGQDRSETRGVPSDCICAALPSVARPLLSYAAGARWQ